VLEKNLAMSGLGQYHCLNCGGNPGMGIAVLTPAANSRKIAGKAVRWQSWMPTPEF
jgi:hypothetical protein